MTGEFRTPAASPGEVSLHGAPARFAGGLHQVAEGTWAWLQPNGDLGESNAGFVVGDDESLLIDTLWDLPLTRRMLDAADAAGVPKPKTLFNTHSDGDHFWGNQLVAGAEIISTAAARELMTLDPPAEMRRMRAAGRGLAAIGSLPLPLVGTLHLPYVPRLPLRRMGSLMAPFDWRGIELTFPGRTFSGREELTVGGRRVELIEVGSAHTAGDAIAWVPDVSVCFAADVLFVGCTPIMWGGPVDGWIKALEVLEGLAARTYVPGHGPPCAVSDVALLRRYFEWVKSDGVGQLASGASPVKVARHLLLSDQFSSLPWFDWDDPSRLVVTLCTEHHLLRGGRGPLRGRARSAAIVSMQRTAADIARRRGVRI